MRFSGFDGHIIDIIVVVTVLITISKAEEDYPTFDYFSEPDESELPEYGEARPLFTFPSFACNFSNCL